MGREDYLTGGTEEVKACLPVGRGVTYPEKLDKMWIPVLLTN